MKREPHEVLAAARHYAQQNRPVIEPSELEEDVTEISELALAQQVKLAKQEQQLDDRAATIARLEAELGDLKALLATPLPPEMFPSLNPDRVEPRAVFTVGNRFEVKCSWLNDDYVEADEAIAMGAALLRAGLEARR